ncbi:hypothetical protein [Kitasatospora sp. NPDC050543]|uniref:hypothetical protein n=1 Tax=Kitasatospora sp. NPDC050543 TaxID=3364054 RepID=UPI00379AD481
MDVSVHIESLVLDGVELGPGGAERLRAALVRALARELAGRPVAWPQLRAPAPPTVPLPAGGSLTPAQAVSLGRAVGRALGAGFTAGGGPV